ncbi:hypothetical protein [Pseudoxanthomonas winnipegensis]|uniref:hypothetical protein n=1 Tax=Pseudoxanthomonas winnipegensis TaxID=2480810 RepID=UPI00104050C8|nr:hypothetical protein [Pseudoxanthomonas winnipegensis]TBV69737.1 hypothetical protein EYC45_18995 [Pseudoxanthomonas winnipegensis]
MKTYTFKAFGPITAYAEVDVWANSLEEAIAKVSTIKPHEFSWDASPDSACYEASIDEVEIEDDESDGTETIALEWISQGAVEGFSPDACVVKEG